MNQIIFCITNFLKAIIEYLLSDNIYLKYFYSIL